MHGCLYQTLYILHIVNIIGTNDEEGGKKNFC